MPKAPVSLHEFTWEARPDLKWEVRWKHPQPGKDRLRRRFPTHKAAKDFFDEKMREVLNRGRRGAGLPEEWVRDATWAWEQLEPVGADLRTVVADYLRRHNLTQRSVNLKDAAESYLEAREGNHLAPRSLGDVRARLRRFYGDMPADCRVSDLERSDVRSWLEGLGLAAQTQRNFQRVLHTFFEWGKERGYCEENPAAIPRANTKRNKTAARPVEIFTPAELRLILETCPQELLAFHVLGAFCGIRTAELERLKWSDVDFERALVSVSPEQSKTAARRFVPLPDAAKMWLLRIEDRGGAVTRHGLESHASRQFRIALAKKGLPWKQNGMRHSFASYALALHEDAPKVSLWLGQSSPGVVFRHYRERATKTDAQAYFNTSPRP
ncbi:tyrosine-type recombinase/integrase [Verrucomicrobium spinosum]|uniref:tyrosine-type recombinase/integrase n=1 Tax=Verrucomicrobium spinosum TaxID=2736 RepID=UPI000303E464|nr:tyrosine-type recombinase/integrase [Verrucomicrobium spinosum]